MGSPVRDQKTAATRSRIAEAALELFVEQGYAETSIDHIARAAGVSRRTVFRHFATKEAMLVDHLVVRRELAVQRLEERPGDEPPLVSLHAVLRQLSEGGYDRRMLAQIRSVLSTDQGLLREEVALTVQAFEKDVFAVLQRRAGASSSKADIRAVTLMALGWLDAAVRNYLLDARPSLLECFDEVVATCLSASRDLPTTIVVDGHGSHRHEHGHVHLDDADWEALAAHTEREGELLLGFVTGSVRWIGELRGPAAPPVRRVLDIGSGPGVGTCELARLFPDAHVVAVDGSRAMLDRTTRRAAALGLDRRIATHLAEVPAGLDGLDPADVIWASMSLHHVGDETHALRLLRDLLEPSGLLALAEVADPMRVLPDDLDVGRPGLADRLDRAESEWFAAMRAGLAGSVPSTDLPSMLTSAGFDVLGSRLVRERFDPPLSEAARRVVVGSMRHARHQLDELLDDDDLRALDVLSDDDDPRGVKQRADVFVAASRQIVIARPSRES